ncbi:MAG: PPC domain-containing protein [Planctomycetaceae bacterium]
MHLNLNRCLSLTFLFLCSGWNERIAADPPKIERLFPPGGQRGTTVEAKVIGSAGDETPNVWSAAGQVTLAFNEKNDSATVTIPADATPGLHWLRFYNSAGATDLRPFVVGLVAESAEVEPNNRPDEAQALTELPVTLTGVLEKTGDADVFAVTLTAGQTFVASMQAHRDLGSPMDGVLQLLNSNGTVIAHNDDDHGFDPQIAFDVPTDGTYYVRTFAFPSTPNSSIQLAGAATYVYRLTMTTGAFIDHTRPVVVTSAQETTVELHGWNLGETPRLMPVPAFEGDATTLAADDVTLPVRLTATRYASLVETPGTPLRLNVPSAVTGVIAAKNEADVYEFEGRKGQSLTATVAARSMHSLLDPVLTIKAADGKSIKDADDRSREDLDSVAAFKLPADGTYTATVFDRFGDGGSRYVYLFTLEEAVPSFNATVKDNAFVLTEDKPLEVAVTVARENGFADALTVTVEGLPDGVTAEPVVSEPKGDTAKTVTLKLARSETAAAFSGTIRIVATGADAPSLPATAPIKDSPVTTADLWLTVIAPKIPEPKAEDKPAEDKSAEDEPAAE